MKVTVEIDDDLYFSDIPYEVEKAVTKKLTGLISDTLKEPAAFLATIFQQDSEMSKLIETRKQQIRQVLLDEIEENT